MSRVFDPDTRQTIVVHGDDRIAISYDDYKFDSVLAAQLRRYDAWVDLLHERDDARKANSAAC